MKRLSLFLVALVGCDVAEDNLDFVPGLDWAELEEFEAARTKKNMDYMDEEEQLPMYPMDPDLTVTIAPAFMANGNPANCMALVPVQWTECNEGQGDSGPYIVGMVQLGTMLRPGLAAGQCVTNGGVFQAFAGTPSGMCSGVTRSFTPLVGIDLNDDVAESNENNNFSSTTVTVQW